MRQFHSLHRAPAEPAGAEEGTALVIALVFLIVGALVVVTLTNLTGVNLTSTSSLQGERAVEYAADGGVDGAIQALRYDQPAPVQASGVYQAAPAPGTTGACPPYDPTTPLDEDAASYYTYASCTFMTFATGSSSAGSDVISPAGGSGWCVPGDVGQLVWDANPADQGNIPPATVVTGCQGTSWTVSNSAGMSSSSVTIGTPGERIVLFSGCAAQFQLSSCTPPQSSAPQPSAEAFVSAVVDFTNTDPSGSPEPGYRAFVENWTVTEDG